MGKWTLVFALDFPKGLNLDFGQRTKHTTLSPPKRFFLSYWRVVRCAQDSIFTGPCSVTADWRRRKTTWGLLITCPWFNGRSFWFVCPAGASGQDSKIVLGWWTGKGSQGLGDHHPVLPLLIKCCLIIPLLQHHHCFILHLILCCYLTELIAWIIINCCFWWSYWTLFSSTD